MFLLLPNVTCLESGASQQSFATALEILTAQAEEKLGRKQASAQTAQSLVKVFTPAVRN